MNKTHIRAYTKCLVESAMHRATALEIELAVGLAVMHETQPSKRLGRETLLTIYNGAGFQCDAPGALDWRAVNRRITATIALYDAYLVTDVAALAEKHKTTDLVEALRPMIKALKLKSVNEVLLACDKVRAPRKASSGQHVEGVRIEAGHLHFTVPASATREDMLAAATKLMEMAMTMFDAHAEPESVEAATGETVEA